jgi:uncharacterized protein (TIGR02452 family)
MSFKKSWAAEIARDTVAIMDAGEYRNARGEVVPVRHLIDAAVQGTTTYPPDASVPNPVPTGRETKFEVTNETTLAAARRLVASGRRVMALNFASARKPGGGFLGGAIAQEESICRASALFACLDGNDMYRHHAPMSGGFYTNYAIHSPAVPVFKDDEGTLLDEPYLCGFITAPAVNAGVIGRDERDAVPAEMEKRIRKVLAIAAHHGHDALVLGAWGCGVFKNDPAMIADAFRSALVTRFAGVFEHVAFAIYDRSGSGMLEEFETRFPAS